MPLTSGFARLVLELADVRTGRECPPAAATHDDGADVVSGLDRPESVAELEDERAREQVERRVDELEVGDPTQREGHQLAHDTAPKSAASPIGPSA